MISTRKKRWSNKRLLSQLDDFDQGVFNGNAINSRQENTTVIEGSADQENTVGISDSCPAIIVNLVDAKTLEKCFY